MNLQLCCTLMQQVRYNNPIGWAHNALNCRIGGDPSNKIPASIFDADVIRMRLFPAVSNGYIVVTVGARSSGKQ